MPNSDQLGGKTPKPEQDPFYVLLADDRLITRVAVTSDMLLEPVEGVTRKEACRAACDRCQRSALRGHVGKCELWPGSYCAKNGMSRNHVPPKLAPMGADPSRRVRARRLGAVSGAVGRGGSNATTPAPLDRGGDPWDQANLQTLCRACHIAKTREENRRPLTGAEVAWRAFVRGVDGGDRQLIVGELTGETAN